MSDLNNYSVDDEMAKYIDAFEIKNAGVKTQTLSTSRRRYNPNTNRNDVLAQMRNGGYVKIGEEPVIPFQDVPQNALARVQENQPVIPFQDAPGNMLNRVAEPMLPFQDAPSNMLNRVAEPMLPFADAPGNMLANLQTAAPTQPTMSENIDQPMDTTGASIESALEYADTVKKQIGKVTAQDLLDAGYAPETINVVMGGSAQDNMPNQEPLPEVLSEQEIENRIRNGERFVDVYEPTIRETGRVELTQYLLDLSVDSLAEDLRTQGIRALNPEAESNATLTEDQIATLIEGEKPRLENEARSLSGMFFGDETTFNIGVGDFVTAGIMDIQEGARLFKQGRTTGVVDRGFGTLLILAGLAEATGVGLVVGKAIKKSIPGIRRALTQAGEAADVRIADEAGMVYSNPLGPLTNRMISLIGKLVREPEKNVINTAFPDQQASEAVQAQVATQKNNYPAKDGWLQEGMEVANVKQKKDKVEVTYKEVPYNFHIPPENVDPTKWQNTIKRKTVNEIKKLADRAAQGDPAAKAIIEQANWYRAMRTRMRQEFGGLGDVFADLLGTTSAQTGVTQNFDNAVEIMRRFSRGEFDNEIRMYEEMLAKGETNPVLLGQMHNDPNSPFKLITKASGSLFNANSPASTRALLDLFRSAKGSPKTPNFTGNLIGYTNAATVDVWAARFLRRMSGQKRLPPPIEKGVSGKHMVGSTLADPKVGAEFGFGQRVIQDAVNEINKKGFIKNVAPDIGEMGADDLQAVLWFLEKEIWTNKGWTSKAGEGGSLDFEASLAGAADQSAIKNNREIVNKKFKPPNRRRRETDDEYAARVQQAQEADAAAKVAAQEEINAAAAPLVRYVLGISVERPGARPTNVEQANVAARLGEPAKQDETVAMYQVNNSYGRFMQSDERAFNAEFVVRENFDPTALTRRMVEVAKDADQDAAFISKIVPERTADSRPGVEIYFRNRQDADYARDLFDELTKYNVDGFTFITDARVADQPSRQAGMNEEAVAGLTGIRFQYIPEFDMGADAWNAMSAAEKAAKIDEIERIYRNIIIDMNRQNTDISTAIITHNETNVIGRDGYDAILGTTAN